MFVFIESKSSGTDNRSSVNRQRDGSIKPKLFFSSPLAFSSCRKAKSKAKKNKIREVE